jgi:cytochrome c biogenesis protein ResB
MFKRCWKWVQKPKLAVVLLVYITIYSAIATLLATNSNPLGNISGLYPIINSIRPQLMYFGLDSPYSSWWLIIPSVFLLISTIACAVTRTQVASRRIQSIRELHDISPETLEQRGICVSSRERTPASFASVLKEYGLTKKEDDTSESDVGVFVKQTWALYASPVFHWTLVLLMIVIFVGVLSRAEGYVRVAESESVPLNEEYVGLHTRGLLYRFPVKPLAVRVASTVPNYVVGDIEQGFTAEVELLSASGETLKKQYVYPNNPLVYSSLMIHRVDEIGLAVHFLIAAENGQSDAIIEPLEYGNEEMEFTLPARIQLHNPDTGQEIELIFLLEPAVDEQGNPRSVKLSEAEGGIIVRNAETREKLLDDMISVGDTIEVFEGLSITLEKVSYMATFSVVDDWSVLPIYLLFALATLLLSVALLTSPAAAVVGPGSSGATYSYLRTFRPTSYTHEEVYQELREDAQDISGED